MKYIKLFENFSPENPVSITVVPTEKYKRALKEIVNSEGKPFELIDVKGDSGPYRDGGFRLTDDRVKIATTAYASAKQEFDGIEYDGVQDIHWLSYDSENSEIYVSTSRLFSNDSSFSREFRTKFMKEDSLKSSDDRIVNANEWRKFGLVWLSGYECKFPKGFEVGMEDERGYFKITKVEPKKN